MSLPIHLIASHHFLPALLAHISLPLDHVIFQSILLCLIAGDKHLILRTPEEDLGLVLKLTVWTLSSIFNLSTHKLKIRSRSPNLTSSVDTSAFLRSLFLPSSSNSDEDNAASKIPNHHRQPSHSRLSKHKKSRSFSNNLAAAVHPHASINNVPEPLLMSGSIPEITTSTFTALPSLLRPRPIYPNDPTSLPSSHDDPSSARHQKPSQSKQLPQALVISGLEYATDLSQRTFANVLADRSIILGSGHDRVAGDRKLNALETDNHDGTFTLPDGFITVYVCPLDTRERPPIHKTLLDKFAMSSNVFIAQDLRQHFRALPFSSNPRPPHPHFPSHSNPGTPSPSHPMSLPQSHTPPTFTKPLPLHPRSSSHFNPPPPLVEEILPRSFLKALSDAHHKTHISHTLSLYLADIFSAARHHPRLDATLLTVRATKDAEALIRASRVIGTDLTGMELLRPMVHGDDFSDTSSHKMETPQGYQKLADEIGSASLHDSSGNAQTANVLDVSEVDVARIAPRVISHRVRIRDGPEDEILSSVLFGATFNTFKGMTASTEVPSEALTVKSVLVQILSEV